ncbi:uncharacterized protein [Montipora capricornis]|uniref:uncharacterized protein isoform X2 n=1 Tax=Montipora capricornis TaxID=246305 RepID=UPI0035F15382
MKQSTLFGRPAVKRKTTEDVAEAASSDPKVAKSFCKQWLKDLQWLEHTDGKMFCTVCRESKKNPMASSGTNNFRRSTLERHSESQDHQSAVEAKLLRRTMRTTTEKVVSKAEKAIIAAMRTAYFTMKLNIPISHYGEMIEFLKFQGDTIGGDEFQALVCLFVSEMTENPTAKL